MQTSCLSVPHKLLLNIGVREQVKKVLGFWKDSCFFPLIPQIKNCWFPQILWHKPYILQYLNRLPQNSQIVAEVFPLIMQIKITDFTHGLIQLPSLDKEGEISLPFSEEKLGSLKREIGEFEVTLLKNYLWFRLIQNWNYQIPFYSQTWGLYNPDHLGIEPD